MQICSKFSTLLNAPKSLMNNVLNGKYEKLSNFVSSRVQCGQDKQALTYQNFVHVPEFLYFQKLFQIFALFGAIRGLIHRPPKVLLLRSQQGYSRTNKGIFIFDQKVKESLGLFRFL